MYVHVFTCGECMKFRTADCPWEGSLNEPSSDSFALSDCFYHEINVITTTGTGETIPEITDKGCYTQTTTIEAMQYKDILRRLEKIMQQAPIDWREASLKRKSDRKKRHYERILFKRRKNAKIKKLWKQSQKQEK